MPIDPIDIIKRTARKEVNAILGETFINTPSMKFNAIVNEYDRNSSIISSNLVSPDSNKRWFRMSISKWGGSDTIISE